MSAQPIEPELPAGQATGDTHRGGAGGDPLHTDQKDTDTHVAVVGVPPLDDSHHHRDTQFQHAVVLLLPAGHSRSDTHFSPAGGDPSHPPTTELAAPMPASSEGDLLGLLADILDDLEKTRIANENRARSLRQVKGVESGPVADKILGIVDGLAALEHTATLELKRAMRAHPLGPWVKSSRGIGEKQGARLIAAIGDPLWRWDATAGELAPRTLSQLRAYCGYHVIPASHNTIGTHSGDAGGDPSSNPGQMDPDTQTIPAGVAPSRTKGQKANWNSDAKMRAFLCAEAAQKAGVRSGPDADDSNGYDHANRHALSPYGQTYIDGRAKYADATHPADCRRCGPSGKPALAGSPLSEAHKHARAMRLVSKQILKDLWNEATRLAEEAN